MVKVIDLGSEKTREEKRLSILEDLARQTFKDLHIEVKLLFGVFIYKSAEDKLKPPLVHISPRKKIIGVTNEKYFTKCRKLAETCEKRLGESNSWTIIKDYNYSKALYSQLF